MQMRLQEKNIGVESGQLGVEGMSKPPRGQTRFLSAPRFLEDRCNGYRCSGDCLVVFPSPSNFCTRGVFMKLGFTKVLLLLISVLAFSLPSSAQETLGAITGTVIDPSGAAVPDATVKALNAATNLEVVAQTKSNGSYLVPELPAGTYKLTITKDGFKTETHTEVLVNGNRTTTVDATLAVGAVSSIVEVNAVPLMNQVDTTNGYVVDSQTIEETPLGTGSFTQLAILSPGVHADFLGGSGSNSGLGNQAIFANGNRDTSNSFSLNGVSTNNLFNGNSTSQVGENRFVLNTGENFGSGGTIQTSTSVYGAIGQALPTPPTDAIQEIAVNTSMYDASQGNNSGAHISVLTKSGTNAIHGSAWEQFQNSAMNATPFFYNAAGIPNLSSIETSLAERWAGQSRRTNCFTSSRTREFASPIKRPPRRT